MSRTDLRKLELITRFTGYSVEVISKIFDLSQSINVLLSL